MSQIDAPSRYESTAATTRVEVAAEYDRLRAEGSSKPPEPEP